MARVFSLLLFVLSSLAVAANTGQVEFQRDIQPLFAEYCYECHGPDAQKGGLNLATREGAVKVLESDATAIVPGHPEKSEALARLMTTDDDDMMPQRKKAKRPTK